MCRSIFLVVIVIILSCYTVHQRAAPIRRYPQGSEAIFFAMIIINFFVMHGAFSIASMAITLPCQVCIFGSCRHVQKFDVLRCCILWLNFNCLFVPWLTTLMRATLRIL